MLAMGSKTCRTPDCDVTSSCCMIGTALLLAVPMEMVGVVAKVLPSPLVVWMNAEC